MENYHNNFFKSNQYFYLKNLEDNLFSDIDSNELLSYNNDNIHNMFDFEKEYNNQKKIYQIKKPVNNNFINNNIYNNYNN